MKIIINLTLEDIFKFFIQLILMPDVYIAGSLRHPPEEWWNIYEKIADVVKEFGLNPYVPHINTINDLNRTIEDIHNPDLDLSVREENYKKNLEAIKNSKLVIAEVTKSSTGTGVEIGFALQFGKLIICLAYKEVDITNMVLGPVHLGLIKIIRYKNENDALVELKNMLKGFYE